MLTKEYRQKRFIEKAHAVHGDKYDYSKVDYVDCVTPVCIICPEHGEFWQKPSDHLSGHKCLKCSNSNKCIDTNSFIKKASETHNNKYDYSKVNYVNSKAKICIICPEHGEFWQKPSMHIWGCGCPKCGEVKTSERNINAAGEKFEESAKKIHGDKYDYSKSEYKGRRIHIKIICPIHGEFWQTPSQHLRGCGCPECGKLVSPPKTTGQFIKEAKEKHGEQYDYSKVNYINSETRVCIICPKHGEFWLIPNNHLRGSGCPLCRMEHEFIQKAKEKYGGKYDYSKVKYVNANTPVCIIDHDRGEFWQKPLSHLSGKTGCSLPQPLVYTYEMCEEAARKCHTIGQFFREYRKLYKASKQRGWLNDFVWLEAGSSNYIVYVYEFDDVAYVGLTNNIKRRDFQHRDAKYNQRCKQDSVFLYAQDNNRDVPEVKILEENLSGKEASDLEKKWIKTYKSNGWCLLNKNNGGSVNLVKEDISNETILEFSKQCSCMEDMRRKNRTFYNLMIKRNIKRECFPEGKFQAKAKPYDYTEEFIKSMVEKYPRKCELRKHECRVYQYLHEHNILYDYYPKGRVKIS